MTYMEALQWANGLFRSMGGGFASPMLDAEVLLAAATDLARAKLFLRFDVPLWPAQLERFEGFVRRRCAFEPVAYIIGRKEFYGRPFSVNPFTLIPRPATETLVDAALALVRNPQLPAASYQLPSTLLADIGTGSGAIAVTLAAETGLPVIASDVNRRALAMARCNADACGVLERVDIRHGSGLEPLAGVFAAVRAGERPLPFDQLILCANLPYLPDARWDEMQEDIRAYEPRDSLLSGPDGLRDYWELFRDLKARRGDFPIHVSCVIEIDPTQAASAPALIRHRFPDARIEVSKDLEGFDRVVTATGI